MRIVRRTLGLLARAWIALAIATPGVSGMVLCVAADGHLALEPAHEGGCQGHDGAGPAHDHRASETASCADDDCSGGCVDLPIASEPVLPAMKKRAHDSLPQHGLLPAVPGVCADAADADPCAVRTTRSRTAPPGSSSFLLAQSTIVLRT